MKRLLHPGINDLGNKRRSVTPTSSSGLSVGRVESPREPAECVSYHSIDCEGSITQCFGSLLDLALQVREDPFLSRARLQPSEISAGYVSLMLVFKGEFCWLSLSDGEAFGCLNTRVSRSLRRLTNYSCVEVDCIASASGLEKARSQWRKSGKSAELPVCFNIYGHEHAAQGVGDMLAAMKMFLQIPAHDRRSLPHSNPQYLYLPGVDNIDIDEPPEGKASDAAAEAKEVTALEIEAVLDHIPQADFLQEHFANSRIRTILQK
ncbi:hypothetical protein FB567DRAFT_295929 [Paraphoma chrysanthemicola]|uniref:Uncharacterized protein n=1 Tax=Paraphoma chrysanthemicola TaxID=798071 RepID=A0A8K0W1J0_9PLEO|nr:hypothetical protein FB567DRAFT_295929 [Paraphoma chrysanthemicola]